MLKLITATELKLQKAKYYLRRMEETQNNLYYLDFFCELESFLMHANSVTNLPNKRKVNEETDQYKDICYMEKEFRSKPGFQDWYNEKMQELRNEPIMKLMCDERNIVVHYNGTNIHVIHTTEVTFTENLVISDSFEAKIMHADGTEEITRSSTESAQPSKPSEVLIKHTHLFNTNILTGNKEVIPVCKKYFEILEGLMNECHIKGFA